MTSENAALKHGGIGVGTVAAPAFLSGEAKGGKIF